jgi:hypothetical protein
VTTDLGHSYYRQNTGDGGGYYASQGSGPLHFGVAGATTATVIVNWPSGVVDTLSQLPANSIITVTEGSSSLPRHTDPGAGHDQKAPVAFKIASLAR